MEDSLRILFGAFGMLLIGGGALAAIGFGLYDLYRLISDKAYIKGYADGWKDGWEAAKRAYEPCVKELYRCGERYEKDHS